MTHSTNTDTETCIFCKILERAVPSTPLYEDDYVYPFLDIQPVNKGHTLVIPKDHFENIYTVPSETWLRVQMAVQKIALAIKNSTGADGINILMNNESAAGQIVPHAHVHIIPRHNDDGFKHWPQGVYKDTSEPEQFAKDIRAELEE